MRSRGEWPLRASRFRTFFDPAEFERGLRGDGFHSVEDSGAEEINARYFRIRDRLKMRGRVARS